MRGIIYGIRIVGTIYLIGLPCRRDTAKKAGIALVGWCDGVSRVEGSQAGRIGEMFPPGGSEYLIADNLNEDIPVSLSIIEINEHDLLPCSQSQPSIDDGNR